MTTPTRPRTLVQVAVVGVGGAGVNAISRLLDATATRPGGRASEAVRFIAVDTSAQTLARAAGVRRLLLDGVTRGLGTGRDVRLGAAAARAGERELRAALAGADLVFLVAGLAGGTGGGAAPEVARIARALRAVTIAFAVPPFAFEAGRPMRLAAQAQLTLEESCHATVVLDSGRALAVAGRKVPLDIALRVADDVLRQAVQGLTELVGACGWINVDFAVVRDLLLAAGQSCLALGLGRGPRPARAAMRAALASPLVDMAALRRAGAALVQVSGGQELAIADTADAVALLRERLAPDCRLVVGAGLDPALAGAAQVTILGTGIAARPVRAPISWPLAPAVALHQAV
jgi:cell division protein FtsZ